MPSSIRERNLKYTRQVRLAHPAARMVYGMSKVDGSTCRTSWVLPRSKTEEEIVLLCVSVDLSYSSGSVSSFFSCVFCCVQVASVQSNAEILIILISSLRTSLSIIKCTFFFHLRLIGLNCTLSVVKL